MVDIGPSTHHFRARRNANARPLTTCCPERLRARAPAAPPLSLGAPHATCGGRYFVTPRQRAGTAGPAERCSLRHARAAAVTVLLQMKRQTSESAHTTRSLRASTPALHNQHRPDSAQAGEVLVKNAARQARTGPCRRLPYGDFEDMNLQRSRRLQGHGLQARRKT
jgi:hypothetical protein